MCMLFPCRLSQFDFGSLITNDSLGQGSIEFITERNFTASYLYTLDFQDLCCGSVGLCDQFYSRRQPVGCSFYIPPRFSKW